MTAAQAPVTSYLIAARNANAIANSILNAVSANGGTVTAALPQIGVVVAESANPSFMLAMSGAAGVQGIVPDMLVDLPGADAGDVPQLHGEIPLAAGGTYDALLWGLDVVDAPEAWAAGVRGAGVRVAVLDAGIDHDHPDLAANLNAGLSISFIPGEDWRVQNVQKFNHGTHVSGTIAADDNGTGVTGVAPDAELVAIKVCTEFGTACFGSSILQGIVYAADIDADLINMSLGGIRQRSNDESMRFCHANNIPMKFCATQQSQYIQVAYLVYQRAFEYAFRAGTTVVVSAGNSAVDSDHNQDLWLAFADFPHTIGISALGPIGFGRGTLTSGFDTLAYYSNYGRSATDFGAPGGNYGGPPATRDMVTTCTLGGVTELCWRFDGVLSTISLGWGWAQGTSMAAPHATGVAALLIGQAGGDLNPSQVYNALRQYSDDLGAPGQDPIYGTGRVNSGY